jgi:CheY-like chemotaxis protein
VGKKKALVIEDNPMNQELFADLLEEGGFEVIRSVQAEEGIRYAQQVVPDMILMDISLPGMDGLEAATILKGDQRTRSIPVIALTAHAMKGDEERAKAAGYDGYIIKPINTRSFIKEILGFLGKGKDF